MRHNSLYSLLIMASFFCVLAACSSESDPVVNSGGSISSRSIPASADEPDLTVTTTAEAVFPCDQLAAQPVVINFFDSFSEPNWGERHRWGYDADTTIYPPLDSDADGVGDTSSQPPNTVSRINKAVSTPAVAITDGIAEGIPQRAGSMLKITVKPGDEASGGNRSEILLFSNQDPVCSEAWYAWSFLVPVDFQESPSNDGFHTVGQWHAQRDIDSSDPQLQIDFQNPVNIEYVPADHINKGNGVSDRLVINSKIFNFEDNTLLGVPVAAHDIVKGQWVDIVVHIKWSLQTDGFVEGWVRDVVDPGLPDSQQPPYEQVVLFDGTTRYQGPTFGNSLGNFFKLGLYRKRGVNDDVTGVVYYDEFKRGSSFDEVALSPKVIAGP